MFSQFFIIIMLCHGVIAAGAALSKHRSPLGWFCAGTLLGFVALIGIAAADPLPDRRLQEV